MATESQVYEVLRLLSAAYSHSEMNEAQAAVYVAHLADLDGELLHRAASHCILKCEYLPSIATIRREAEILAEDEARNLAYAAQRTQIPEQTSAPRDRDQVERVRKITRDLAKKFGWKFDGIRPPEEDSQA